MCKAPGVYSADALVTANGHITVQLNGSFEEMVVCDAQYHSSSDQIENTKLIRDTPALTINVTSLLKTVLNHV